jgi:hypothetical protein
MSLKALHRSPDFVRGLLLVMFCVGLLGTSAQGAPVSRGRAPQFNKEDSGPYASVSVGCPIGSGEGGNEFEPAVGLAIGWQARNAMANKKRQAGTTLEGLRIGIGYAQAKNKVGDSATDGVFLTPFYYEYYGNLAATGKGKGPIHGLQWIFGMGWHMLTLDDADGYNHIGSVSGGLGYQYRTRQMAFDIRGKVSYIYNVDLGQNAAYEIGLVFAY